MKKIISLFLAITTLICILPLNANNASSVFTDATGSEYYYTAAVSLAAKGIIKGYPDGSFGADKTITRAETAAIMCRMIGKESEVDTEAKASYFTDVPSDHWALGYINLATNEKIFSGDGNGRFRPEDKVSYQEVIKLVLCAAGYGDNIKLNSEDWSLGYVNLANLLGITEGIVGKKDEALTRGDIAVLCYNSLSTKRVDNSKNDEAFTELAKLNPDNDTSAFFDENDNLNVFVGKFYDQKITDGEDAVNSLELVKDFIGIEDPENELEYVRDYESGEDTIYVLNQMYNDIPVYGRTVKITTDSKNYTSALNSGFLEDINVSTENKITKNEAEAIVQKNYEGYEIVSESVEKVIYSIDTAPFIAWTMEVSNEFDGYIVFVDATTGEIAREFSTVQSAKSEHKFYTTDPQGNKIVADTTKTGDTYSLEDPIRNIKTVELITKIKYPSVYKIDKDALDKDSNDDGYYDFQLATTAHTNVAAVYDYYADRFNFILTYDNTPVEIQVAVPLYNDDRTDIQENSYSTVLPLKYLFADPGAVRLAFGVGDIQFTGLDGKTHKRNHAESVDIVAHEFTHRVVEAKSPELAKHYYGFTGSINEAYSDIMAIFAEARIKGNTAPDWIGGETSEPGGSRNLKNPHLKQTPAYFGDQYTVNPEYFIYYQDPTKGNNGTWTKFDGGTHENSTIISHAAYLMWDKGIKDISKLEKLWFKSMDGYDASSDFWDVRYNVLAKAQLMGMTEEEIQIISDSFDEVGIRDVGKDVFFYVIENHEAYTPIAGARVTIIPKAADYHPSEIPQYKYTGFTDENGLLDGLVVNESLSVMNILVEKEGYASASKIVKAGNRYFILLDKLTTTDPYLENQTLGKLPSASQVEIVDNMSFAPIKKGKYVCEAPGTYYVYPKDPITDGSSIMYNKPANVKEALAQASVGYYNMYTYECFTKPADPDLFFVAFKRDQYAIITMTRNYCSFPAEDVYAYKVEDSTVTIPANTTVAFKVCRDFSIDTSKAKGLSKNSEDEKRCFYELYDSGDVNLCKNASFERPIIFTAGQTIVMKTGKEPVKFTMPFRALSIRRNNLSNIGL